MINDILTLQQHLNKCYSRETSHPSYQDKWNDYNPSTGHCAIVSMIVQDYFGGDIYKLKIKGKNQYHYYNVIDNNIIDITKDQFKNNDNIIIDYLKGVKCNRPKSSNCICRYNILKDKLHKDY